MTSSLTQNDYHTMKIINMSISGFCCFGYAMVYFIYWFFKEIRSFSIEQVIYLCISCTFYSLSNFLQVEDHPNIYGKYSFQCNLQSYFLVTFQNSILIWTSIIGYIANLKIQKPGYLEHNQKRFRIIFLLLGFLVPCLFSLM